MVKVMRTGGCLLLLRFGDDWKSWELNFENKSDSLLLFHLAWVINLQQSL